MSFQTQPVSPEGSVFIGIDFGTTGHFHAYRQTPYNHRKMAFSRGNQLCKVKAPTSVVIGQPDKDGNRRDCWGIPLSLDEVALRWFKLALVHADDLPREVRDSAVYQEAEALRDSYGLSAATVTQTYLSGLWTYTLEMMAATEGITLAEVEKLTKHVVIGVPANWRPDALLRLREAAQRVGIPGPWQPRSTLDFFSEPEAATLTLVEKQEIPENLTVGDIMIVCDCGGGTADAVSYELSSTQPFTLDECAPGDMRFCGSVLLDGAFMQLLEQRIRQRSTQAMAAVITERNLRGLFDNLWENRIKPEFDGSSLVCSQQLPASFLTSTERRARIGTETPTIEISREEMITIFQPTVDKIIELVKSQVEAVLSTRNKAPKALILCGGFGGNRYLQSRLVEELHGRQLWGTIQLYCAGEQRLTAVSHGCVMHAVRQHGRIGGVGGVRSRLARDSYGFGLQGCIRQFIKKGEKLPVDGPKPIAVAATDFVHVASTDSYAIMIYQGPDANMVSHGAQKFCEISWTGQGRVSLEAAIRTGCSLTLAANCSGISVGFEVYIDNDLQKPGHEVVIRYGNGF